MLSTESERTALFGCVVECLKVDFTFLIIFFILSLPDDSNGKKL
jgi:hypothetical protein